MDIRELADILDVLADTYPGARVFLDGREIAQVEEQPHINAVSLLSPCAGTAPEPAPYYPGG